MSLYFLSSPLFKYLYSVLVVVLWIFIPTLLLIVFLKFRLSYKRFLFLKDVEWDFLEIKINDDIIRTPKSMEQVFASLFGIYSFGIKWIDKYLKGKVDLWISFEIVGDANGIRFYIKTPSQYRGLVESSFYAQYPNIEISSADDYVYTFGKKLPNETFDLWGADFSLIKDSAYPLRTYESFENPKEEKSLDPLSTIFETLSRLKKDETVFIQIMISPTGIVTGYDATKKAEEEAKKILKEKSITVKSGEEESSIETVSLTPGVRDIIKAIENKASKFQFETTIRFIYIDKKNCFNKLNTPSVMGSFQQFNAPHMNAFKPGSLITIPKAGILSLILPKKYKDMRLNAKKRRLFEYYSSRTFGLSNHAGNEKIPILGTEELATLYHFPRSFVGAPGLKSTYSKKGSAPPNLPIE